MINMHNGSYRTSDTPEAAWLYLQGETYLGIEHEDGRGYFIFAKSSTLNQNRLEWNEDNQCNKYYRCYRVLVKKVQNDR